MTQTHRIVPLVLLPLLAACGAGTEPSSRTVARLAAGDPLPVTAFVGTTLRPTVRAFDAENRPVAGVTVRFASARGSTSVPGATAVTDGNGVAVAGDWGVDRAEGRVFVVPMRDPASRRLDLDLDIEGDWTPLLAAYGRTDPASAPVFLASGTGSGSRRRLTIDVPGQYLEVLVLVGQPLPLTVATPLFTLQVN